MASDPFAIVLAALAVPVGAWLVAREAKRAPVARPLAPLPPDVTSPGPIASFLADRGAPAERVEAAARAILLQWIARKGLSPAQAAERLDPALARLLDGGGAEAWARAEARGRWRGPGGLFPLWWTLAAATSSRDARRARYLDAMTLKLTQLVDED